MMDDYWGHGVNGGYDAWNFVLMLLIMASLVIGAVVLVRYLGRGTSNAGKAESALDLLKKRYAKGEINKEEFEEKRKDLIS